MPIVRIELFKGRSPETKAAIAEGITNVLQAVDGIPPTDTTVIFVDVERSDWAVAGRLYSSASNGD